MNFLNYAKQKDNSLSPLPIKSFNWLVLTEKANFLQWVSNALNKLYFIFSRTIWCMYFPYFNWLDLYLNLKIRKIEVLIEKKHIKQKVFYLPTNWIDYYVADFSCMQEERDICKKSTLKAHICQIVSFKGFLSTFLWKMIQSFLAWMEQRVSPSFLNCILSRALQSVFQSSVKKKKKPSLEVAQGDRPAVFTMTIHNPAASSNLPAHIWVHVL